MALLRLRVIIRLEATSASGTDNMDYMKVNGTGLSGVSCTGTARLTASTTATTPGKLEMKCYPLPAHNGLHLEFNQALRETVQISLLDATGKVISTVKTNSMNHNLDLTGLSNGVYLIKVTGTTVNMTKLITKQ
jgi:hypothetical protein